MLREVVHDDHVAGVQGRAKTVPAIDSNTSASAAPSTILHAVVPSFWIKATMVVVHQCSAGVLTWTCCPRGSRHRKRFMLVFAPDSSRNTRRAESSMRINVHHRRRSSAMSSRSCSPVRGGFHYMSDPDPPARGGWRATCRTGRGLPAMYPRQDRVAPEQLFDPPPMLARDDRVAPRKSMLVAEVSHLPPCRSSFLTMPNGTR